MPAPRGRRPVQRGGGNNGFTGKMIGALLVAVVVFTFIKIPSHQTSEGILGFFQGKAAGLQSWIKETVGDGVKVPDGALDLGNTPLINTPSENAQAPSETLPTPSDTDIAKNTLDTLTIEKSQNVDYNRDEWKHWDNITSCWNVRDEVLYRQAEPNSITLLDKNKNVTNDKNSACSVSGGTWNDPYTGQVLTNPADLDIDHMIPLGYAAHHGGQEWSSEQKEQYANDLESQQLIAVFASANRQKSDKGPSEWKPQASYQCQYAKSWVSVASKWKVSITQADKESLQSMLATCS